MSFTRLDQYVATYPMDLILRWLERSEREYLKRKNNISAQASRLKDVNKKLSKMTKAEVEQLKKQVIERALKNEK